MRIPEIFAEPVSAGRVLGDVLLRPAPRKDFPQYVYKSDFKAFDPDKHRRGSNKPDSRGVVNPGQFGSGGGQPPTSAPVTAVPPTPVQAAPIPGQPVAEPAAYTGEPQGGMGNASWLEDARYGTARDAAGDRSTMEQVQAPEIEIPKEDRTPVSGGSSKAFKAEVDGKMYLFKEDQKFKGQGAKREELVSNLAKIAGLNIPESKLVDVDGKTHVQTEWVEADPLFTKSPEEIAQALAKNPDQAYQNMLFDYLIDATDGHDANFLMTPDGKLVGIDKEISFGIGWNGASGINDVATHTDTWNTPWFAAHLPDEHGETPKGLPPIQGINELDPDTRKRVLNMYARRVSEHAENIPIPENHVKWAVDTAQKMADAAPPAEAGIIMRRAAALHRARTAGGPLTPKTITAALRGATIGRVDPLSSNEPTAAGGKA